MLILILPFYLLSLFTSYLLSYLLLSEDCGKFRCFTEMEDSDSFASNGNEHDYSYYSIYSNLFVSNRR